MKINIHKVRFSAHRNQLNPFHRSHWKIGGRIQIKITMSRNKIGETEHIRTQTNNISEKWILSGHCKGVHAVSEKPMESPLSFARDEKSRQNQVVQTKRRRLNRILQCAAVRVGDPGTSFECMFLYFQILYSFCPLSFCLDFSSRVKLYGLSIGFSDTA